MDSELAGKQEKMEGHKFPVLILKKKNHCPNLFLRRERQYSMCNSEDSPGSCEILYFSVGSPDQLMVHKGKCIGE